MDHTRAISIFKEIQNRPYRLPTRPDLSVNNCFSKGIELIQRLGVLGYAVRGRICETFWDEAIFPREIVALHPDDTPCTHFFVELETDGVWRILDSTFPPAMAKLGCTIGNFSGTPTPCFPVVKLYTQEESIRFQERWEDPAEAHAWLLHCFAFLTQMNEWLESMDV